jgi:hypothetical protein
MFISRNLTYIAYYQSCREMGSCQKVELPQIRAIPPPLRLNYLFLVRFAIAALRKTYGQKKYSYSVHCE